MVVNPRMPGIDVPTSLRVAFKEWRGACEALATGRQTVILRKGGIHERGGVFRPEHAAFWLFPTTTHASIQGLKPEASQPDRGDEVSSSIDTFVCVTRVSFIRRLDQLLALDAHHVWTEETMRGRFAYREPGIWLMLVRAYRLPEPWLMADHPRYHGCKSWVILDEERTTANAQPALDDETFARCAAEIENLVATS